MVHPGTSGRRAAGAKVIEYNYGPGEMVRTPQFYFLWLIYLFGAGVGLMVISQAVRWGSSWRRRNASPRLTPWALWPSSTALADRRSGLSQTRSGGATRPCWHS